MDAETQQANTSQLSWKNIRQHFSDSKITYLAKAEAVCYVLWLLKTRNTTYGTQMTQLIKDEFNLLQISDTVLYNAIGFLEDEGVIQSRSESGGGRGRPRTMYTFKNIPQDVEDYIHFWTEFSTPFKKPEV
jgi:hypothetical protein